MANTNKAGAAGRAAALPSAELAQQVAELGDLVGKFSYRTKHEALVLVHAAQNLADCHRVLADIDNHRQFDPDFDAGVTKACASANNPQSISLGGAGPFEIIQNLLRVAGDMLEGMGDDMEAAESTARHLCTPARGEQA